MEKNLENNITFIFQPDPEFEVLISMRRPGGSVGTFMATMKWMSQDDLQALVSGQFTLEEVKEKIVAATVGWVGVDVPFSADAMRKMLKHYPMSWVDILRSYRISLEGAREKNSETLPEPSVEAA